MSHGVDGCSTFKDDLDRKRFLYALKAFVLCGRLVVHAYCLMGNHFHLLCQTPNGMLSRWMQQLLCQYSRCFNFRHTRKGHLWQERYKAIVVQDGDYFLECSRYIHLNPVRAHLVDQPEEYGWSSYPTFFKGYNTDGWIFCDKTFEYFGNPAGYLRFVREGLLEAGENPFEAAAGGIILGDKNFVEGLSYLSRNIDEEEIAEGIENDVIFSPEAVCHVVKKIFNDLSDCQRVRILVYCLRRFTVLTGKEIAALTERSPSTVTLTWHSIRNSLHGDTKLQMRLCQVKDELLAGVRY
jgi:REP element-mobilizing transposase RayT